MDVVKFQTPFVVGSCGPDLDLWEEFGDWGDPWRHVDVGWFGVAGPSRVLTYNFAVAFSAACFAFAAHWLT